MKKRTLVSKIMSENIITGQQTQSIREVSDIINNKNTCLLFQETSLDLQK